ncbi:sensor domain-containing diguanylate cyclase [Thiococcus pfennigii]|uniref:sensor domain-containing diguanylate cyclase n=1 Tax=Thiococcus pfennigii TaxID=1057 RepID=UPI0019063370|nr:sensor domain-containing diguanylate cyclase [Thiococcus pfennigii]
MARHSAHSLAVRATRSILTVVALIGAFNLALGYFLSMDRESREMRIHLQELLDTVERPASIACFLRDPQLAGEVAAGLLANSVVAEAVIATGTLTLARAGRGAPSDVAGAEVIVRRIVSPFDPDQYVGEIRLTPDQAALDAEIARTSLFIAALMLVQTLAIGAFVALVVYGFVTRPLKRAVAALLGLPAEEGGRLPQVSHHEQDEIGELIAYVNRLLDRLVGLLHQERDLRRELAIEGQRFRSIFENAETGIFLLDGTGGMLSYNPACRRLLPVPERADELSALRAFFKDDDQAHRLIALCRERNQSIHRDVQIRGTDRDASVRWIQLTLTPIGDEMFQGVVNDITERKIAEARALLAARTDPLTGLLNRAGFIDALGERLNPARATPRSWAALMIVDLDLFKTINDTYGHAAGDRVLMAVARRLKRLVRMSDPVGRFGGDEFVLLMSGVDQLDVVERLARKIVAGVAREIPIGDRRVVRVGVSVGIALSPLERADRARLFKEADEAMYEAKRAGRNAYRFFSAPAAPASEPP